MDHEQIMAKITSRDTHQVWSAACEIITFSQNRGAILPLIGHLQEIQEKTKGLEMGGAFAPNQRFVDFAIRIIEFYRDSDACSCNLYLEHSIDPNKEAANGYVRITKETQGNWETDFEATCLKCAQPFNVNQNDGGHFSYFTWSKAD